MITSTLQRHSWMPRKRMTPRRVGKPAPRIKAGRIEDPAHLERLRHMGCYCCRFDGLGWVPSEPHHPRPGHGTGQKADDRDAIPLCRRHHNEQHPDSVSIHRNPKEFRRIYGTEAEIRDCVLAWIEMEDAG